MHIENKKRDSFLVIPPMVKAIYIQNNTQDTVEINKAKFESVLFRVEMNEQTKGYMKTQLLLQNTVIVCS